MLNSPAGYQLTINPFLPVDGRARRAIQLFRAGHCASRPSCDPSTIVFHTYLVDREACRNRAELRRLRQQYAPLVEALRLRSGDAWRQLEIQARLLTGQSMESIGASLQVTREAIVWYEQLFFGVCDRLTAADYIYLRAIRGLASQLPRPPLCEFIRGLGFFGRRLVLESALLAIGPYGSRVTESADPTTSNGRLVERIRLLAQQHLLDESSTNRVGTWRALNSLIAQEPMSVKPAAVPDMSQLAMAQVQDRALDLAEPTPAARCGDAADQRVA